ncbi:MAG TPA: nucleotidyltransferase domain-containing protein [Thermomicrobiales bacterium]|nr:nucleotidyltransferase domain-containing protein [Thermomicrobiales bacterium]
MLDQLRAQQPVIAELCRRYAVARLEIFGSAVTGTFDTARSGLDFLVAFQPHPSLSRFEQYFGLWEELQALFDRSVDLVMVDALRNPHFIRSVNASRRLLYAA